VTLPNNFVLHDTLGSKPNSVPLQVQLQSAKCTSSSRTSDLAYTAGPGNVQTVSPGNSPVDFFDWAIDAPGTIEAYGLIDRRSASEQGNRQ
jgi:hypothetical protein